MERHPLFSYREEPQDEATRQRKQKELSEFSAQLREEEEKVSRGARERLKSLEGKTVSRTEIDGAANVTIIFDDGTKLEFYVWDLANDQPGFDAIGVTST